jgi:hypothetical protein
MAPSTGVQGSDGIPRRLARPRMHKHLFAIYSVAKHRRPFIPHLTVQGVQT